MLQDHVVAIVSEDALWNILPAIRRHGLGHLARVMRPSKHGTVSEQLRRAGVPIAQIPDAASEAPLVLLVSAAKRSPATARIVVEHGASSAWIVATTGTWTMVDEQVLTVVTVPVPSPTERIVVPGRSLTPTRQAAIGDESGATG